MKLELNAGINVAKEFKMYFTLQAAGCRNHQQAMTTKDEASLFKKELCNSSDHDF